MMFYSHLYTTLYVQATEAKAYKPFSLVCHHVQILIEKSAIAAVGAEWAGAAAEGLPGPAPAASVSAIAARNHALLTKRMQTEQSFPLSAPSSSSGDQACTVSLYACDQYVADLCQELCAPFC